MTPPMGGATPWTRGTPPGVAGAAVNGTALVGKTSVLIEAKLTLQSAL